jgi:nitrile hydratase accessory protein
MPASNKANYDLPALPCDEEGLVFREPWEAHAFALAVPLSEATCFSWPEWTALLSQGIQEGDGCTSFYHYWLSALERICIEKGLVTGTELHRRKEEWRWSYFHTPHGQSIELPAAVG